MFAIVSSFAQVGCEEHDGFKSGPSQGGKHGEAAFVVEDAGIGFPVAEDDLDVAFVEDEHDAGKGRGVAGEERFRGAGESHVRAVSASGGET